MENYLNRKRVNN